MILIVVKSKEYSELCRCLLLNDSSNKITTNRRCCATTNLSQSSLFLLNVFIAEMRIIEAKVLWLTTRPSINGAATWHLNWQDFINILLLLCIDNNLSDRYSHLIDININIYLYILVTNIWVCIDYTYLYIHLPSRHYAD